MIFLPLIHGRAWMSLPSQMLQTFNGRSRLPVFEYKKTTIQKPRIWARRISQSPTYLPVNSWELAHAVKKADCARWPLVTPHPVSAAGFLLEHAQLFDWSSQDLRLRFGMSDYYADFARTGIAGRIAQGMALLFLEDIGYLYVGHFDYVRTCLGIGNSKNEENGKRERTPDFVVENGVGERALAESKGGFAKGKTLNIKGDLKSGLEQLSSGTKLITPQPSKSFVVGTYLREVSKCSQKTSEIAYTDPPPEEPQDPVEIPRDAVRRANYASWLSLMGLDSAAWRLWTMSGEPESRTVPTVVVGERQYAVTVTSVTPQYGSDLVDGVDWQHVWDWLDFPIGLRADSVVLELVGLDMEVIKGLESAIRDRSKLDVLMEIEPFDRRELPSAVGGGAFYGSVLSDRSLLGEIRYSRKQMPEFGHMTIEL